MADFNAAAVDALFAAVVPVVKKTGRFRDVITHEPKAKPASLPAVAVWWDKLMPARSSGLSSTSGVIQFCVRVYQASMLEKPEDDIDKKLLASVALLLDVLIGGFTLGGQVRAVDVRGMEGQPLEARSGFISHDSTLLRVAQITLPVIVH